MQAGLAVETAAETDLELEVSELEVLSKDV